MKEKLTQWLIRIARLKVNELVDFKVNGTHATNNCVERGRMKIEKRKIVDSYFFSQS